MIYSGRDKTFTHNDKTVSFYCGDVLNPYSQIFARIAVGEITAQEGYLLYVLTRAEEKPCGHA